MEKSGGGGWKLGWGRVWGGGGTGRVNENEVELRLLKSGGMSTAAHARKAIV